MAEAERQALEQEVSILQSIDHPNVIKLFGMWETDPKTIYIVTELVRGGELFDKIVQLEYFNEKRASAITFTLASTLKFLHERGIVHRDLKPENILMVSEDPQDDTLKLADFGFAKTVPDGSSEETLMNTTCGTPGYVAPEIISGYPYGTSVDCWALGVILYILLCGYPPFYDDNQQNLFRAIKKGKFKFEAEFWDDVSDSAKDLINGLLVVDSENRFNAEDVLQHPWIKESGTEKDITPALDKLKGYQNRRRLKKHVNAIIALNRMKNVFGGGGDGSPQE